MKPTTEQTTPSNTPTVEQLRWVIDADRQVKLKQFNVKDTKETVRYYESLGKWNDVSVDRDGDIILWKEI